MTINKSSMTHAQSTHADFHAELNEVLRQPCSLKAAGLSRRYQMNGRSRSFAPPADW